mmetsp:Transcript_44795/g.130462  ORF Transcript_44795/g.130462 Transcript_44795/m.130462 type:complete len:482 (-) Transcript_44795:144-1589(-)
MSVVAMSVTDAAMSLEVEQCAPAACDQIEESFLCGNTQGNTIAGNSFLQAYGEGTPPSPNKTAFGTSSTVATTLSLITIMVGAGSLVLPQQFVQLGVPLGASILSACCFLSMYLSLGINRSIARVQERTGVPVRTFADLGGGCFGAPGRVATQLMINSFIIGKTSCFIVLIGQNLEYIQGPPDYREWVLLTCGLFLASAFIIRSARVLERVSAISVICGAAYVFPVVVGSLQARMDSEVPPASDLFAFGGADGFSSPGRFLPAFGLLLNCFGPTEVLATTRNNMKDPRRMPRAIIAAHMCVGVFCLLIGVVGAWGFGEGVQGNVTKSMQSDGSKWAAGYILALAVAMNLLVTIPVNFYCLFSGLEKLRTLPSLVSHSIRASVVLFCAAVGVTLPYFEQVLQIHTSSLYVPLTVFFPLAFATKSARDVGEPHSYTHVLFDVAIVLLGAGCFVVGMSSAVDELLQAAAASVVTAVADANIISQ